MSQKTARPSVARMPGMPQILLTFGLTICSLSILLPASPAWALVGGAGSLGAGSTNAVLMAVTVATQFSVPALTRRFSWALVLPVGILFMGLPSRMWDEARRGEVWQSEVGQGGVRRAEARQCGAGRDGVRLG